MPTRARPARPIAGMIRAMRARSAALASVLLVVVVVVVAACSNRDLLVGHWTYSVRAPGNPPIDLTLELQAAGTAALTLRSTECTGQLGYTALRWSADGTNLTMSGLPQCAGMLSCTVMGAASTLSCEDADVEIVQSGPRRYTLSADGHQLVVNGITMTRSD